MIVIDGSRGEGGGQILRSSLALALATGTAVRIHRIRARRYRPGLLRQHLTAIKAAARVGCAYVEGAEMGSDEVLFEPGPITHGVYDFAVGTAGSTSLVLQTLLPALATVEGSSQVRVEGGTHNMASPPFDFLAESYGPLLQSMGLKIEFNLRRHGFYPAGGGSFVSSLSGSFNKAPLDLVDGGPVKRVTALALIAGIPARVAERELAVCHRSLDLDRADIRDVASNGPGNALLVKVEREHLTTVFTGFGKRGLRAESLAKRLVKRVTNYLESGAAVEEHLADQLLLPMALAGGGQFSCDCVSSHFTTNVETIETFLHARIQAIPDNDNRFLVRVQV